MKPLIDADILRYEIGACGQYEEDGEVRYREFDQVAEILQNRIEEICRCSEAEEPPTLFLTNSSTLQDRLNRRAKKQGKPLVEYEPNYRKAIATLKPYKGTRNPDKPYHYDNLTTHMLGVYDVVLANGMEADDMLGICQTDNTIICSRDKDLRMIPGWHYGWECGKQPSFGPELVEELGYISISKDRKSIKGVGISFFFAQMLTGDTVDNIPGLPRCGAVKAYDLLSDCVSEAELLAVVRGAYREKYEEDASERLKEQAQLLWIGRELDKDNKVVPYKPKGK